MKTVVVLGLVLASCSPVAESAPAEIDPASLALPSARTAEPAIEDLPVVILTKTKLVLSGVPRASMDLPIGIESMSGPIIVPLQQWLKEAHLKGDQMAVAIDSAATSELAMEIMATCMDAGFSSFHVAVSQAGTTAQIPLSFGKPDPPNAQWLSASVFAGGVVLKVAGGTLAPGCDGLANGVAVSRIDGIIDRDALTRCVSRAHKDYKTNAASVTVTKKTPFLEVVTLLDAMRGEAETSAITLGISG